MIIRPMEQRDVPQVRAIYNYAVRELTATFDIMERTEDEMEAWYAAHDARYPVFVAVDDEIVAGWASISPYAARPAWGHTVESAVYLDPRYWGQGLGTALLYALLPAARDLGHHVVLAQVVTENPASIRLHRRLGYAEAGVLHEVGRKFDRWLDVMLMERRL